MTVDASAPSVDLELPAGATTLDAWFIDADGQEYGAYCVYVERLHQKGLPDMLSSFPPVIAPEPRVLILGSMPGEASLRANEYYAYPQNAFWPIMAEICGFDLPADYATRLAGLQRNGICLWDVLAHCERKGSLDGDIELATEAPNDIPGLLADHMEIRLIGFNGQKAARAFRRHIAPQIEQAPETVTLPSTSPAHTLARSLKADRWREALAPYL